MKNVLALIFLFAFLASAYQTPKYFPTILDPAYEEKIVQVPYFAAYVEALALKYGSANAFVYVTGEAGQIGFHFVASFRRAVHRESTGSVEEFHLLTLKPGKKELMPTVLFSERELRRKIGKPIEVVSLNNELNEFITSILKKKLIRLERLARAIQAENPATHANPFLGYLGYVASLGDPLRDIPLPSGQVNYQELLGRLSSAGTDAQYGRLLSAHQKIVFVKSRMDSLLNLAADLNQGDDIGQIQQEFAQGRLDRIAALSMVPVLGQEIALFTAATAGSQGFKEVTGEALTTGAVLKTGGDLALTLVPAGAVTKVRSLIKAKNLVGRFWAAGRASYAVVRVTLFVQRGVRTLYRTFPALARLGKRCAGGALSLKTEKILEFSTVGPVTGTGPMGPIVYLRRVTTGPGAAAGLVLDVGSTCFSGGGAGGQHRGPPTPEEIRLIYAMLAKKAGRLVGEM